MHSAQNRSCRIVLSIQSLGIERTEEIKRNTTKANSRGTKWQNTKKQT